MKFCTKLIFPTTRLKSYSHQITGSFLRHSIVHNSRVVGKSVPFWVAVYQEYNNSRRILTYIKLIRCIYHLIDVVNFVKVLKALLVKSISYAFAARRILLHWRGTCYGDVAVCVFVTFMYLHKRLSIIMRPSSDCSPAILFLFLYQI